MYVELIAGDLSDYLEPARVDYFTRFIAQLKDINTAVKAVERKIDTLGGRG